MRIYIFLGISFALHLALLLSMPSLSASPAPPLRKPIWVELVDLKNPPQIPDTVTQFEPGIDTPPNKNQNLAKKSTMERKKKESSSDQGNRVPPGDLDKPTQMHPSPKIMGPNPLNRSLDSEFSFGVSAGDGSKLQEEIEYEKYILEIKTRVLELKRKVEKNWADSLDEDFREGTTVILAFVDEDGSLWTIDILKPSGIILHDYEALEAVKKVFPLRPPPPTLLNDKKKLPIRFDVSYLMHAPL